MTRPKDIQVIETQLAISWEDGEETFIESSKLRAASPSASTSGERDIFGVQHGGEFGKDYSDVEIVRWEFVGNYAIRFHFTDGHNSGLYSYELIREIGKQ